MDDSIRAVGIVVVCRVGCVAVVPDVRSAGLVAALTKGELEPFAIGADRPDRGH